MSGRKRGKARKHAQNRLPNQSTTSAMALPQREHQPPQEEVKAPEPESGPVTMEEKPRGAEGEAAAQGNSKDLKDTKEKTSRLYDDYSLNTIQNLEHVWQSKTGSAGVSTEVCTNHIRVTSQLRKLAYTYHVYYHPKIEGAAAQMILLNQQKSKIGKYFLLDGSSLVVFQKLDNRNMNLISRNDDGSTVEITLVFNTEVLPTSVDYIRYHNIIMRRVLKLMNFEQIGRNYFNHNHGYVFQEHGMEIWPGYSTSVLPYENGLTLCVDACHKVVRFETAYDVICRLRHSLPPDRVRNKVEEELVGCVVITR
ncbi:piwi-like protein 3 [Ochotona princeps]|uniref:piwi-like protein 3 n=1 Tax=Ochotona princeps TaxID=9978 RepID=UPI0027150036|nr:piwi-like protein 3 [Ochotona princeps]